jgi:hypothetical protein
MKIVFVALLLCAYGCQRAQPTGQQVNPLNDEAKAIVVSKWRLHVDGESTFIARDLWEDWEVRGAALEVTALPLDEADKLNHVEWKGAVTLRPDFQHLNNSVVRRKRHNEKQWGQWEEYKMEYEATEFPKKVDGKWIL